MAGDPRLPAHLNPPPDANFSFYDVGLTGVWNVLPTMDEFIKDLSWVPPIEEDIYHYPEYAVYINHPM